ncbi:MFS transporter, partial [Arthrobacter sp. H5]|uniref:MFS transporter n=1 Tax=Arthrobacter sp. H5 TaxID=1267973 RepID=UPI0005621DE2
MSTIIHPGAALSRREKLIYVLILGALTALGPFTIDLYLPAFPALQSDLQVSEAAVQLTLTGTIIGFAAGQLLVGPLSDKVGRRLPLIMATTLHVAASLGAALSTDITMLMIFRVLQGMGAAGGGVVAMAMIRDLFSGYPLVRMLSYMALVNGMAPIFAPVIGSQLLIVMPWPGIFWFLAGYGLLVIIAASGFIVETLPADRRKSSGS